jgi:hypothetical protein
MWRMNARCDMGVCSVVQTAGCRRDELTNRTNMVDHTKLKSKHKNAYTGPVARLMAQCKQSGVASVLYDEDEIDSWEDPDPYNDQDDFDFLEQRYQQRWNGERAAGRARQRFGDRALALGDD